MMIKYCPKCGNIMNLCTNGDYWCPTCHYREKHYVCPRCGYIVIADSVKRLYWCPVCDYALKVLSSV